MFSCHLSSDIEGLRSEESEDFVKNRGESMTMQEWKSEGEKEWWRTPSRSVGSHQGGVSVLWSPCCLFYWPLGERGTEHLCWIEGTTWPAVYLWMILNSLKRSWVTDHCLSLSHQFAGAVVFAPTCSFTLLSESVSAAVACYQYLAHTSLIFAPYFRFINLSKA